MSAMTKPIIPSVREVIESRMNQTKYVEMRFPDDLGAHAIVFNFSDYNYDRSAETVNTVITSSICLPIPTNLVDTLTVRIAGEELGVVGGLVRDLAPKVINAPSVSEGFKQAIESDELANGAIGKAIKAALGSLDNSIVKGGEVALGKIVNPNIALTFSGMDLKTHNFNWNFQPTSSSESVRLQKIIKTLKRNALPSYERNTDRTFMKYPKVADIFFLGTEPGFLYYFKRCLVGSVEANYSGAGEPAFLPSGRPAFITLTMSLQEMEIHTAEDYSD